MPPSPSKEGGGGGPAPPASCPFDHLEDGGGAVARETSRLDHCLASDRAGSGKQQTRGEVEGGLWGGRGGQGAARASSPHGSLWELLGGSALPLPPLPSPALPEWNTLYPALPVPGCTHEQHTHTHTYRGSTPARGGGWLLAREPRRKLWPAKGGL